MLHTHPALCTGAVRWQAQYQHMGPAAAVLLVSGGEDPPRCFAVYDRTGRSPRIYAAKQRDALLRAMQAAALSSLGTSLKGALLAWMLRQRAYEGVEYAAGCHDAVSVAPVQA